MRRVTGFYCTIVEFVQLIERERVRVCFCSQGEYKIARSQKQFLFCQEILYCGATVILQFVPFWCRGANIWVRKVSLACIVVSCARVPPTLQRNSIQCISQV